jgi:hypothetical protein
MTECIAIGCAAVEPRIDVWSVLPGVELSTHHTKGDSSDHEDLDHGETCPGTRGRNIRHPDTLGSTIRRVSAPASTTSMDSGARATREVSPLGIPTVTDRVVQAARYEVDQVVPRLGEADREGAHHRRTVPACWERPPTTRFIAESRVHNERCMPVRNGGAWRPPDASRGWRHAPEDQLHLPLLH